MKTIFKDYLDIFLKYPKNEYLTTKERKERYNLLQEYKRRNYDDEVNIDEFQDFINKYEEEIKIFPQFISAFSEVLKEDIDNGGVKALKFLIGDEEENDYTLQFAQSVYDEFGTNTILTTWLVHDNYGFVNNCEIVDLAGYTAYWCESHLYLINPNLTEESIKALVDRYNTVGNFNPQNIVLFGYSFNYVEIENLKTNVKILRDSEKNLKINLDIRY